ncbi:MAG: hypothetical protein OEQ12_04335 [Nitrosopumilus sp.]|nr:hypothetical protein [Nitrosopumilus sp.]
MQPIIAIAALAVGAGLLSTGFLAGNNEFEIWVQDLGFAQDDIESPIEHANIDFVVEKITVIGDNSTTADDYYKNEITKCSFHTFEEMDDGSEIICKLQSWAVDPATLQMIEDQKVTVCEGRLPIFNYTASETVYVPITMEAYPGACDVMNIDNVKIVASGQEPFSAFCDTENGFVILGGDGDDMFEPWGNDKEPNGGNSTNPLGDDEVCVERIIVGPI